MSTIEKVYSEERAHKSATAIPSSKTPLSPQLKAIARRMFSGTATPADGRPEQQCWDDAITYPSQLVPGDPLTPIYSECFEEVIETAGVQLKAKNNEIIDKLFEAEPRVVNKDDLAKFKTMTKAQLMLHLRDDGITHTMTAMRKMTKAKLETIAIMRSVVIPEDVEG